MVFFPVVYINPFICSLIARKCLPKLKQQQSEQICLAKKSTSFYYILLKDATHPHPTLLDAYLSFTRHYPKMTSTPGVINSIILIIQLQEMKYKKCVHQLLCLNFDNTKYLKWEKQEFVEVSSSQTLKASSLTGQDKLQGFLGVKASLPTTITQELTGWFCLLIA